MKLPLLPLNSKIIVEYAQLPTSQKTSLLGRMNIVKVKMNSFHLKQASPSIY